MNLIEIVNLLLVVLAVQTSIAIVLNVLIYALACIESFRSMIMVVVVQGSNI